MPPPPLPSLQDNDDEMPAELLPAGQSRQRKRKAQVNDEVLYSVRPPLVISFSSGVRRSVTLTRIVVQVDGIVAKLMSRKFDGFNGMDKRGNAVSKLRSIARHLHFNDVNGDKDDKWKRFCRTRLMYGALHLRHRSSSILPVHGGTWRH
jgi:hypothetical protein